MRILVTGDAGFIGSHLFQALTELGHEVVGWDIARGIDIANYNVHLTSFDRVYHLAAISDAMSDAAVQIARTNIEGTARLAQHYRDRLVFASSSMVNFPQKPYAISKRAGEDFVRVYGGAIVRLCNIYGRGGHSFWDVADREPVIRIRGTGNQLRTWAPVEVAVEALIGAIPGTTHVLPGYTCTINEIAARYQNRKPILYDVEHPEDITFAPQLPTKHSGA